MRRRIVGAELLLDAFAIGIGTIAAVFLVLDIWQSVRVLVAHAEPSLRAVPAAAGALVVYSVSHVLRVVRLQVLVGVGRLGFPIVWGCHTTVALLTFAMPLKLGEVLRATELYRLAHGPRGLFAVWLDRLFDVVVVLVLLGAFRLRSGNDIESPAAVFLLAAFLFGSALAVLALPGALVAFERALVHSVSRRTLTVLRGATRLRGFLTEIPRLDRQSLSLLTLITVAIWGLELLTVFFVLLALPSETRPLADQAIDTLNYTFGSRAHPLTPQVALYRLLCVAALAGMVVAGLHAYLRARLRLVMRVVTPQGYSVRPPFRASRIKLKGRVR